MRTIYLTLIIFSSVGLTAQSENMLTSIINRSFNSHLELSMLQNFENDIFCLPENFGSEFWFNLNELPKGHTYRIADIEEIFHLSDKSKLLCFRLMPISLVEDTIVIEFQSVWVEKLSSWFTSRYQVRVGSSMTTVKWVFDKNLLKWVAVATKNEGI